MAISWNDIFQHGTLISMHRRKWQARIRITPEDLGIQKSNVEALNLGAIVAAPKEAFKAINAAISAWENTIEDHSLAFPIIESVRFVPDDQLHELQRKLDLKMRDFRIAVDEFLDDYEKTMHEQLPKIEHALKEAAKTPEAASEAISRVIQEYPSRQKVAEKFNLEWQFFTITVPISEGAAHTARNAVPQVQEAIEAMIENLRTELNDKVSTLISLAHKVKNGTSRTKDGFGLKSIDSANKVLDKVERLNFLNDPILQEQTKTLKALLNTEDMDLTDMVKNLNSIQKSLETDIKDAALQAEAKLTSVGKRKLSL